MARILSLDYGTKRIGVAVSDPLGITAQPVAVIASLHDLVPIIDVYAPVDFILVGLPKDMSGKIGLAGQNVLKFIEEIKLMFTLPVKTWDERLSSKSAERSLISAGVSRKKRKQVIDMSAAALILQNYLDAGGK